MLITPVYAAAFGLLFVALSIRTIRLRRRLRVAIGPGEDPVLARAVRAHSNFAEYVPFALLLVYFLETGSDAGAWIHLLCVALLAGRLVHAFGLSRVDENYSYRTAGMTLTFAVIVSASLGLLLAHGRALVA